MLVLPVPVYRFQGRLYLDAQACNGLTLWIANFGTVVACFPLRKCRNLPTGVLALSKTVPMNQLEVHLLPTAWSPVKFLFALPKVIFTLRRLILECEHLQFAIGGIWGDWGSVGALLAHKMGRRAAVWTDRVESQVMQFHSTQYTGLRRASRWINARATHHYERFVIRRARLGLFHGMDTFTAYSDLPGHAELVHDVHLPPGAAISAAALQAKSGRSADAIVKLIYAGRVHEEKGLSDWIATLSHIKAQGASFCANWYGDGPQLEFARGKARDLGLEACVHFPGPLTDRPELLEHIRNADAFLFCHRTPESPRCLVEALICGTPIIGYGSPYSLDLINRCGGGILIDRHTPEELARALGSLDRKRFSELAIKAAGDGRGKSDEAVFAHRAAVVREYTGHCNNVLGAQ